MKPFLNNYGFNPKGTITLFELNNTRSLIKESIEKSRSFYKEFPEFISGQHILIHLLLNLNISIDNELLDYIFKVTEISFQTSKFLGFTTIDSIGKVFNPGFIYGSKINEIYLANIEPFDTQNLEVTWKDLRPLRVIYHPINQIDLNLLTGQQIKELSLEDYSFNLAMISVNIPMLATQYKFWKLSQSNNESSETINQFLAKYPLNNLIYSHVDLCFFNQFTSVFFNNEYRPNFISSKPTSFFIPNFDDKIVTAFIKLKKLITDKNWNFETVICQIPTINSNFFYEVIRLPDLIDNYNTESTFFVSYLSLIYFLLVWSNNKDNFNKAEDVNFIRRKLIKFKSNKLLSMGFNDDFIFTLDSFIKNKIEPLLE